MIVEPVGLAMIAVGIILGTRFVARWWVLNEKNYRKAVEIHDARIDAQRKAREK